VSRPALPVHVDAGPENLGHGGLCAGIALERGANDHSTVVDPRLVGRRRERRQTFDIRHLLDLDAAQHRRAEQGSAEAGVAPVAPAPGYERPAQAAGRLDRRRDDGVALRVRSQRELGGARRELQPSGTCTSATSSSRSASTRGPTSSSSSGPASPSSPNQARCSATRSSANRKVPGGIGARTATRSVTRSSGATGRGSAVRSPSQTIGLPRPSSQWYEHDTSSRQVTVPAFSISTRAPPSAPAWGSSSIQVSQRATSGPGTALV